MFHVLLYICYYDTVGLRNRYQKLSEFFRFFELFNPTISGKEFTHRENGQIFGMEGS